MDVIEEIHQLCDNVTIEETSNIISQEDNHILQYEKIHKIMVPPEEKKIAINVSALKKVRYECDCAKKHKFTYAELWLGMSTMLGGAFLSAIISSIPYEWSILGVLYYSICPIGSVGFWIAYFFCRKSDNQDIIQLSKKIEEYLPNPEEMEDNRDEY